MATSDAAAALRPEDRERIEELAQQLRVDAVRASAATEGRPTAIVARTVKGKGVTTVADEPGAHGKPLDDPKAAIDELGGIRSLRVDVAPPPQQHSAHRALRRQVDLPRYEPGADVATRKAYGEALTALGTARSDVVALDGEVSNSTYAGLFAAAHPDRYFEMFIAEQQLVAAAVGLAVRGFVPFASTFAAFLTRAYDFIRMAAVSRAAIRLCGSHAGVSIGDDGPSQMGLEDIAMMRAVHGSAVLYPCDANQAAQLVAAMADHDGIAYMRTTRAATPVLYHASERFAVGGSRTVRWSDRDAATLVAAGITVHEALAAADELAAASIATRVLDCYSVKPIDAAALRRAAEETGAIVTIEDHWPEGGLGDAAARVLSALDPPPRVLRLGVDGLPTSGTPAELLRATGISRDHISDAVDRILRRPAAGK